MLIEYTLRRSPISITFNFLPFLGGKKYDVHRICIYVQFTSSVKGVCQNLPKKNINNFRKSCIEIFSKKGTLKKLVKFKKTHVMTLLLSKVAGIDL